MKIYPLIAEDWKCDAGAVFGVVPKTLWRRFCTPDENNNIVTTDRCPLVIVGDRVILFDTGMGEKQDEQFFRFKYRHGNHSLVKDLAVLGLEPDDVTDVVFTHLHWDHVGGAFANSEDSGVVACFPQADYWVTKSQWDWAVSPNPREAAAYPPENIIPLKESGKLNFITQEGEFCAGIRFLIMDGHTRGQLIPVFEYRGKTVVFTADFIPTPYHIPLPYVASYDIEPLKTLDEKSRFLSEAFEKEWVLMFQHDKDVVLCTLTKSKRGAIVMGELYESFDAFDKTIL